MFFDIINQLGDFAMFFSIFAFSAFLTAYRKNKIFAAIILILLFVASQMNVLHFISTLPLLVAIFTSLFLLLYETINDYKHKSHNELLVSLIIILLGLLLGLLMIKDLVSLHLIKFFTRIEWLKIYALALSFLLCYIQYNKQNNDSDLLEANQNNLKIQDFNPPINNSNTQEKFKFNKIYLIIIIIFTLSIGIVSHILNTTVIDLEKVVQLKYNTNKYISDVEYYTPWEYYDQDNFYTDLYKQADKLAYTESQVKAIIPTYSPKVQKKLKKADLQVKLDHNKDITYNEDVEFDIKYNEKYARKHNLKFKNTHFTKKAIYLKHALNTEDLNNATLDFKEIKQHLKEQISTDKIDYTKLKFLSQDLVIKPQNKYDISFLELKYELDGQKDKLIGSQKVNNLVYQIEIYQKNDNIILNWDNSKISYNGK